MEESYLVLVHWSATARATLREKMEILCRDCQSFATDEIGKAVAVVNLELVRPEICNPKTGSVHFRMLDGGD